MLLADQQHAQGQDRPGEESLQPAGDQCDPAAAAQKAHENRDDGIDQPGDLLDCKDILRIDPDIDVRQGQIARQVQRAVRDIVPDADRHGVLLQLIGRRAQPGGNDGGEELLSLLASQVLLDLLSKFLIDLRQAADLPASPAVKNIHRRIFQDRIRQRIHNAAVELLHVGGNDPLHRARLDQFVHLTAEFPYV